MPVDLLHELETGAPAASVDQLENTEEIIRQIIQRVRRGVDCSKGSVNLFENTWRNLVAAVAEGKTAEVQELRERFLKAVEDRLRLLKHTQDQAAFLRSLGITQVPDPALLVPERTGMERLKSRVCERWQTAADLEDLAARDYPLTTADLDRIGPKRQPPASWYAEESKPF